MSERTRTDSLIGTPVLTLATRLTAPKNPLTITAVCSVLPSEVVSICCKPTGRADPLHHTGGRALFSVCPTHVANVRAGGRKRQLQRGRRVKGGGFRCYTTTACDKAQAQSNVLLAPLRTCCYTTKDVGDQVPSVSEAV